MRMSIDLDAVKGLSGPMEPEEFRKIRTNLGLKLNELAPLLGIHVTTAGLYQTGKRDIPGPMALAMRLLQLKAIFE